MHNFINKYVKSKITDFDTLLSKRVPLYRDGSFVIIFGKGWVAVADPEILKGGGAPERRGTIPQK
jgi:hypothetical protein